MHGILNRKLTGPGHELVSKVRVTGLVRGTNAIFTSRGRWLKCSCLYIILNMNTVRPTVPELKKSLQGFLPERMIGVLCRRYYQGNGLLYIHSHSWEAPTGISTLQAISAHNSRV